MKKFIFASVLISSTLAIFAQNSVDALRYSRLDNSGTARYTAMGSSFGALGGEVSALSFNPGGIGVYRNSEFTFSTGFNDFQSNTSYRGINKDAGKLNFNIPNIAYVGSYKGDANGWKNYSFALNYNRLNNFNSDYLASGTNESSTIVDDYVNILNNNNASVNSVIDYEYPFGPSQAYNLLLIDYINDSTLGNLGYVPYVFYTVAAGGNQNLSSINQERRLESRGSQSETQFTFGGNYQDRLYLGGSIGYQYINYEQNYLFREDYTYNRPAESTDTFTVVTFQETEELIVDGRGVNFKIGAIYKINEMVRAGITVHSPTYLYFNETYLYDAKSVFAYGEEFRGDSITSNFGYQIRTPAKLGLSLGLIPNSNIALNVDYTYINYSTAKLDDRQDFVADFSEQNEQIDQFLGVAHNFNVGGELKLNPVVLRAGYSYQGNPYNKDLINFDEARNTYSIGGGFRNKNFNFDVALNYRETNTEDGFYNTNTAVAEIEEKETNLVFTFGWKW